MPSRRQLEVMLETLDAFESPQVHLEQYLTPPSVAASLVHEAAIKGDLEGTVVDLGTGTGILAIAAASYDPSHVIGLDIDRDALRVANRNIERQRASVDLVLTSVSSVPLQPPAATTVVMNPPFGAQIGRRGADRPFLEAASSLAQVSYSIHNAESRTFVEGFVAERGGELTDVYAIELDIPAQFSFHDESVASIAAEAYRIEWDD